MVGLRVLFGEVSAASGFDLVVDNPPYVRADHLGGLKEYLTGAFRAYNGAADLYFCFIELRWAISYLDQ